MSDSEGCGVNKRSRSDSVTVDSRTVVLERSSSEAQSSLRAKKRLAQHQHWMRVMMEGQSTPDPRFQKPKK